MFKDIDLNSCNIGFIGAGNICQALVKGFLKEGSITEDRIHVTAPTNKNLDKFRQLGCHTSNNNDDLLPGHRFNCHIIFLCVKPNVIIHDTFGRLRASSYSRFLTYGGEKPLIVLSLLAGVNFDQLDAAIPVTSMNSIRVYRIMSNTGCSVGEGSCAICSRGELQEADIIVEKLMNKIALTQFLPENLINAFTGISGSGIAYGFTFIQALADGGVKMGLPRNIALKFAAQTLLAASKMLLDTGRHPIELRDAVCSPSGTTIHGVHALEKASVPSGIMDAIEAATNRANNI